MLPPVDELNALDEGAASQALAPIIEGAPRFGRRLAGLRPYASYDELLDRALEMAMSMPEEEQIELIDSHPRIGAAPGTVGALSYREQGYDHDPGTADLQVRLDRLNEAYEHKFGFRFVIFVAGRPRSAIAKILEMSLGAEREAEKVRALTEVIAIARDRAQLLGRS